MLDVMSADIIFFLLFDRFIINSCQFEVFTGEYRPNMGRMEQIWGEGIFLKHVEGGQRDFSTSQVKLFLHTCPATIAASLKYQSQFVSVNLSTSSRFCCTQLKEHVLVIEKGEGALRSQ